MFQVPTAVLTAGLLGCRGDAEECRERDLTGRDSDRFLSVYSPGVLADSEELDRSSSSINIPDGSRYFISALIPVYPDDVRVLLGNFMPQDPYMFFVAFGHVTSPFLYLPAFRLVEIVPRVHRAWRRDVVVMGPTLYNANSSSKLVIVERFPGVTTALRNLPAYTVSDLAPTPAYITFVHACDASGLTFQWLHQICIVKNGNSCNAEKW
ncbi:hypothetical protein FIBSPDRAFT_1010541 [Athelia psychrophila]|uniref:Uncharacterized protein n=1 Tax=Athelia psychrophila TaxID=1759441 RepID=A0A166ND58_9AGAM|nr:hypothetical protein FIBSPDRAFT_1010541 [Fibularhizoctonia sp. CBS 109695]